MDRLPLELFIQIGSHLLHHPSDYSQDVYPGTRSRRSQRLFMPPGMATVSRKWQYAVERVNFRDLYLQSTELDKFMPAFSTAQSHRRQYLRRLDFKVVLPTYSDEDCAKYETDQDRLANNKAASDAVLTLFNFLAQWGSDPNLEIELDIDIHSPMDCWHRGQAKYDQDLASSRSGDREDFFAGRYEYSYISISEPNELPLALCIKSVKLPLRYYRVFHPSSALAISAMAFSAEKLSLRWAEPDVFLALRRPMRNELAQSLTTFRLPPSVQSLNIITRTIQYQGVRQPNLVFPHDQDPVCLGLHRAIGDKLKKLHYAGLVAPSLFWPYAPGEEPSPFWQSMEELKVEFYPGSPCGRWYLCGEEGDVSNVPGSDEPLPVDMVGHMPPGYGSEMDTQKARAYLKYLNSVANGEVREDYSNGGSRQENSDKEGDGEDATDRESEGGDASGRGVNRKSNSGGESGSDKEGGGVNDSDNDGDKEDDSDGESDGRDESHRNSNGEDGPDRDSDSDNDSDSDSESDATPRRRYEFRTVPNNEVILPLLEAFARAIAQMPALKMAKLYTLLDNDEGCGECGCTDWSWCVKYAAPGHEVFEYKVDDEALAMSKPRVFFAVGDWRPTDELLDLFRATGMAGHQQEAAIFFVPFVTRGDDSY